MGKWGDHCTYCGNAIAGEFPRFCTCGEVTYASPLSVGVTLLPVMTAEKTGVLIGQRNIAPCKGEFSLLGGFAENKETPSQAAVRELSEETTIQTDVAQVTWLKEVSVQPRNDPRSQTLHFYVAAPIAIENVPLDFKNEETQSIDVVFLANGNELVNLQNQPITLCFPEHHKAAVQYLQSLKQ